MLLSKDLNVSDFQYVEYNKNNNNDIFLKTLIKRIKEYNKLRKNKGVLDDDNYNEKIFGFNFNVNNNYFYLYSTIDEDIISNKLKENYQNRNDNGNNMDYFEELTFEELVIYFILERLEYKYELLPSIIYYEYYLTINGDRVIFSNKDLTGYSNIDYVIYSKCNCKYNKDETPLIIKERYRLNEMENEVQFEIKNDTLYFFISQSSLGSINKGNNFFEALFRKYEEFLYLYKCKSWIDDKTQKEIMLICDNYRRDLIYNKYRKIISQFLMENKDCSLNIVYSKKSYCFLPHYLSIKKYNDVKSENENLKKEIDKLNKKLDELNKKPEKIEAH